MSGGLEMEVLVDMVHIRHLWVIRDLILLQISSLSHSTVLCPLYKSLYQLVHLQILQTPPLSKVLVSCVSGIRHFVQRNKLSILLSLLII